MFLCVLGAQGVAALCVHVCSISFTVSAATSLFAGHLLRLSFGLRPSSLLHHGVSPVKRLANQAHTSSWELPADRHFLSRLVSAPVLRLYPHTFTSCWQFFSFLVLWPFCSCAKVLTTGGSC